METARTRTVALIGIDAHLIDVEAEIADGLPVTVLAGLPDTALREARDRIRAAIVNSGERWPGSKITVGLYPATLPKRGSAFDLAIAVAIVAANGDLPALPESVMFLSELGLDGQLRPVPGVLPAVLAAADAGIGLVVVAAANLAEATQVPGVTVIAADSLAEVAAWLRGGPPPPHREPPVPGGDDDHGPVRLRQDLADVLGQAEARRALEICATGGHHLSLLGAPGTGTTMLAERLPTILPPLETAAALEVTSVHSVAGALRPGIGLITDPPFVAPHHTSSKAAIVGGGSGLIRPGAASLAHRGVLFLDQAPEFHRDVLDALRQPLEYGKVVIARASVQATFPARFILVIAASPCPCAATAGRGETECRCPPAARRRYLGRLSGPLLDRVDAKVSLRPASREELLGRAPGERSTVVAQRVAAARQRSAARLAGTPWQLNAEVPGTALRRCFPPATGALKPLERALELGQVSARGADKVVRVAWSLADLAARDQPGRSEIAFALGLWIGATRSSPGRIPQ